VQRAHAFEHRLVRGATEVLDFGLHGRHTTAP
jgi:hypothetical protein